MPAADAERDASVRPMTNARFKQVADFIDAPQM
jgi:hypothetical protein